MNFKILDLNLTGIFQIYYKWLVVSLYFDIVLDFVCVCECVYVIMHNNAITLLKNKIES